MKRRMNSVFIMFFFYCCMEIKMKSKVYFIKVENGEGVASLAQRRVSYLILPVLRTRSVKRHGCGENELWRKGKYRSPQTAHYKNNRG